MAKSKIARKPRPSAAKLDSKTGLVVMKAGEHVRIEVPARESGG